MFINISNHSSEKWSKGQLDEAKRLAGEIRDIPFPNVPADMGEGWIRSMAQDLCRQVLNLASFEDAVVMVQGEFSLTVSLVLILHSLKYKCVAACSERQTVENADGSKTARFEFVRFREYCYALD